MREGILEVSSSHVKYFFREAVITLERCAYCSRYREKISKMPMPMAQNMLSLYVPVLVFILYCQHQSQYLYSNLKKYAGLNTITLSLNLL